MRHADLRCSSFAALILAFVSVACSRDQAPPAAAQSAPPNDVAKAAQSAPPNEVVTAAPAVIAPGTGWIEGTITDTNGTPPVIGGSLGVPIALKAEGNDVKSASNPSGGGFFAFRNLKPGLYEVFIDAAHPPDSGQPLRPVHVSGIAVEAGRRTVLNVKMQPGQELEEIGKPTMTTQKFVVVSEELERLQAQIDELKKK
jgi:hypothetical protein